MPRSPRKRGRSQKAISKITLVQVIPSSRRSARPDFLPTIFTGPIVVMFEIGYMRPAVNVFLRRTLQTRGRCQDLVKIWEARLTLARVGNKLSVMAINLWLMGRQINREVIGSSDRTSSLRHQRGGLVFHNSMLNSTSDDTKQAKPNIANTNRQPNHTDKRRRHGW